MFLSLTDRLIKPKLVYAPVVVGDARLQLYGDKGGLQVGKRWKKDIISSEGRCVCVGFSKVRENYRHEDCTTDFFVQIEMQVID